MADLTEVYSLSSRPWEYISEKAPALFSHLSRLVDLPSSLRAATQDWGQSGGQSVNNVIENATVTPFSLS
jgi:hypothetical protein